MSDKRWLKNYPEGVPEQVDLSEYHSIIDVLEKSCNRYRENAAFTCMGSTITYAELDHASRNFAAALQARGLKRGDRVALMMPNIIQYPIALFGVLRAGLTVVNTNPMYTARELRHQLLDSGARAIVVVENFAHVLQEVKDEVPVEHVFTTGIGDLLDFPKGPIVNFVLRHVKKMVPAWKLPGSRKLTDVVAEGEKLPLQQVNIGFEDIAFLQYTGGTTGVAKGAMLTHRNMVANMLQARAWLGKLEVGTELIITALPLYHIFALTANCLTFMSLGGENLLIPNPRDMKGFVAEISRYPFTSITGVNTLFNGLLNTEGFEDLDFSHLKMTLGGGMAVQRAVADRWKEVTGVTLVEAYGLTETSPAACINPMDMEEYNGCIGLPISSTECMVMGEDGREMPQGEAGELCVRGPQVMKGYWQRPEATAEVLTPEGWLKTGDVAVMTPDGYFRIVDRKKDMILVSGFNVYPNEIEDVVALHPKVLEVAAIGVPDERSGEAVKLCVVKRDPSLDEAELKAFCSENLTGYKRPRHVEFFDELPKSNVGKILRKDLREQQAESGQG
ncbi:MAG: AMP-binding protein [Xanthomonadales bacterium]|nr:AMP-binding protein [Xanthomonadales bacterium]NIX13481.1 AMP-binding protein [Xanthomonadales bacterium]